MRRFLFLAVLLFSGVAYAITPGQKAVLFSGGAPSWVPAKFQLADLYVSASRANGDGTFCTGWFRKTKAVKPCSQFLTRTGTGGTAFDASGNVVSFPGTALRATNAGLTTEEARTNVVLQNRDLTNASWTKTNITAAKDQTGVDGVANSASSITATAGNGTALQAVTLASSQRFQSAFVKRITGTGVVNMTTDGGTTWTVITVTAAWARVSVPAQTVVNPSVGFRIVTNADAIAVDFVQNETGAFATTPITTAGASVTRAQDFIAFSDVSWLGQGQGTLYANASVEGVPTATNSVFGVDDGTFNNTALVYLGASTTFGAFTLRNAGAAQFNLTSGAGSANTGYKLAGAFALNDGGFGYQGTNPAARVTSGVTVPSFNQSHIGVAADASRPMSGTITELAYFASSLPNSQLQALTQ